MDDKLKSRIKNEYLNYRKINGIPVFLNEKLVSGDNGKYMKMYDRISIGYDMAEKVIGKLKYGNSIDKMRREIVSKLEWKNSSSVLYVSIGTGKDLHFIPEFIDKKSLEIFGADISIGMLKKCGRKFKNKLRFYLVNCAAEELPFKDNEFDIVFHVGGINFFNDKSKAVKEMIRVAKKGTKILIADETADFIEKQYKKSRLSRKYFEEKTFDLKEIESSVPNYVSEKNIELLWENRFYCMTFRK